jgi:hypothetical protein
MGTDSTLRRTNLLLGFLKCAEWGFHNRDVMQGIWYTVTYTDVEILKVLG